MSQRSPIAYFKRAVRLALSYFIFIIGVHRFINKGTITILMYHRVIDDKDSSIQNIHPGMYVTTSVFKKHITYLKNNYEIISLDHACQMILDKSINLDKRYCVITFDDGWLDNYTNAFPVLRQSDVEATIFITTSLVNSDRWFWPELIQYFFDNTHQNELAIIKSINRSSFENVGELNDILSNKTLLLEEKKNKLIEILKLFPNNQIYELIDCLYSSSNLSIPHNRTLLNWNEINEMSLSGLRFGSHTCEHQILTSVAGGQLYSELVNSKQLIEEKVKNGSEVFCYPNGSNNSEIQNLVKACGYVAAVTTKYGVISNCSDVNMYALPRIGIHNDMTSTVSLFSFRLLGIRI